MDIKEQVLSIEQAKHLQELGLDMSDAALCYRKYFDEASYKLIFTPTGESLSNIYVPTYTLQEVLGKLPEVIFADHGPFSLIIDFPGKALYYIHLIKGKRYYFHICCDENKSLLDLAYQMLCFVLESKLPEPPLLI